MDLQLDSYPKSRISLPRIPKVPRAPYRHAAPSGPWPWQNLDDNILPDDGLPDNHTHDETLGESNACHWTKYPQSLFPNWKAAQVSRSRMKIDLPGNKDGSGQNCILHMINVTHEGHFEKTVPYTISGAHPEDDFRKVMQDKTYDSLPRLRAFFVEDLTLPVMQLLGTEFVVEPFFWTSSVNWIPSRYQENPHHGKGDHITVTLKFPRAQRAPEDKNNPIPPTPSENDLNSGQVIDTQRPLPLRSKDDSDTYNNHIIITDLLSLHLVRSTEGNTLITYHPAKECYTTAALDLSNRVYLAGQSVYWKNIFKQSDDPTFVLLATLWYALYAWDEAFETLWNHICDLELKVIKTNNMELTLELHKIRAHLLHYASLLEDFEQTIIFIRDTPNPALESGDYNHMENTREAMGKECHNLLIQIKRLKTSREMWDKRLKNVMHLVFSSVNIQDSSHMKRLTEAAVRDSAAMKQISYLTMVFLPASFIAAVFGMNIEEINPGSKGNLSHYFETAIPLTIVTAWVIVAFQTKWNQSQDQTESHSSLWRRFLWPYDYVIKYLEARRRRSGDNLSERTLAYA